MKTPATITIETYPGMSRQLTPETSMRIRKVAAEKGVSVEEIINSALKKSKCVNRAFFLPVNC